jgi:hypothetical protein
MYCRHCKTSISPWIHTVHDDEYKFMGVETWRPPLRDLARRVAAIWIHGIIALWSCSAWLRRPCSCSGRVDARVLLSLQVHIDTQWISIMSSHNTCINQSEYNLYTCLVCIPYYIPTPPKTVRANQLFISSRTLTRTPWLTWILYISYFKSQPLFSCVMSSYILAVQCLLF